MTLDEQLWGRDILGEVAVPPTGPIHSKFVFPPWSLFDARQGDWRERKAAWARLGLLTEETREGSFGSLGPNSRRQGGSRYNGGSAWTGGTASIFDPVLAEIAYRWFCPPGGQVVDPFAGGVCRGAVASALGLRYWGCDVRPEQIAANGAQFAGISTAGPHPDWVAGDCRDLLPSAPEADLLFSCPPYGDLERYSDDPRDLSTLEYHTFVPEYKHSILLAARRLRIGRFACFVVGDFRDDFGYYRGFIHETVQAFLAAGLRLYNQAVILKPDGSASLRLSGQFSKSRKLVKIHETFLVFVKGCWQDAVAAVQNGTED